MLITNHKLFFFSLICWLNFQQTIKLYTLIFTKSFQRYKFLIHGSAVVQDVRMIFQFWLLFCSRICNYRRRNKTKKFNNITSFLTYINDNATNFLYLLMNPQQLQHPSAKVWENQTQLSTNKKKTSRTKHDENHNVMKTMDYIRKEMK